MKSRKLISALCAVVILAGTFSMNTFANTSNDPNAVRAEKPIEAIKPLDAKTKGKMESEPILDITSGIGKLGKIAGAENSSKSRAAWQIKDPIFVGNGTLVDQIDIYLVTPSSSTTAGLKLTASDPNLIAMLYKFENGNLGPSTGVGVKAGGEVYVDVPAGTWAIVIGSSSGTARGNYKLMWNASNPSGAKVVIKREADLSNLMLYYGNNNIRLNGNNIITDLRWEEHETWFMPNGHSGRDMVIDTITSKGTYIGGFQSSAPYSTNNALFVEVQRGSYLYFNSYYSNIEGQVQHVFNYFDPSGLETPRTFGTGNWDFSYGPSYIVIDLNTYEVVEFLSPFNFHYTIDGKRTFSLSDFKEVY